MKFTRTWAMPSADTFDIAPIGDLVKRYLRESKVSVDPFARNKRWATYTNDLNPDTAAECHMDACDFLMQLIGRCVSADLVLFDPPYSPRQIAEVYKGIGRTVGQAETQHAALVARTKDQIENLVAQDGIVISCGWNSGGMGVGRGYAIEEILMVNHGGSHNDTIVTVERRLPRQVSLQDNFAFEATAP